MNYGKVVERNKEVFTVKGFLKLATDLAMLLDNSLFKISLGTKDGYDGKEMVETREFTLAVFNKFCQECSVKAPAYEKELYRIFLPNPPKNDDERKKEAKQKELEKKIFANLNGIRSERATFARALGKLMVTFHDGGGYSGIKQESLMAIINNIFDSYKILPLRSEFPNLSLNYPYSETGPEKEALVVIFDDSKKELMKTGRRLAGWPNLKVLPIHFKSSWREDKDVSREKAAKVIMKHSPAIVLMDQGLGEINGHEVVLKIKELYTELPIFVANTGGTPDELISAGCLYENCNKGESLSPIRSAIARLGR